MPRLFTLSQARRSLPEIAAIVIVMRKRALRLDELTALASSMRRTTGADGDPVVSEDSDIQAEMSRLEGQIAQLIDHIQQQGVEVKDIRRGLVDWRAERDGREVYLCWQYGERTVSWWHELADGFAGRQPIVVSEWA
ncbi:MAG: DUF2203 domain-containing protein [Chloroflexota bacterium]|nr:DUF2203 domain-containing protein [Chloroflexota bacterium]MDE2895065.1 DUF2203 domain-containing protein [Chloroflexota bacterium]